MKKQQIVAAVILTVVVAWMAIPRGTESTAEVPEDSAPTVVATAENASASENPDAVMVRARQVQPEAYIERIRVRGRTQAQRHVQVRAEQAGRIISDPVPRGSW
ncbi:MAG: hypothetical protein ACE37N_11335 [Pseudohongiellaceae bacterium]